MRTIKITGMTIMELMVAVAIVGILAAVALPSYLSYIMRTQRSDATSALLKLAASQEKFYLQNNAYTTDMTKFGAPTAAALPSEHGWYEVKITVPTGTTLATAYLATATPTAGSPQVKDTSCTSFTIDQSGLKEAFKGATNNRNTCWR